jgi:hypothetical protein
MANFIKINNAANFNENNSTPSKKNLKKNKYHELVLNTNKKLSCKDNYNVSDHATSTILVNITYVMRDGYYDMYSKKYIYNIISKIFNKQDISVKESVILGKIIEMCIGAAANAYKGSIIYTDTRVNIIDKIFLHNYDKIRNTNLELIIDDGKEAPINHELISYIKLSLIHSKQSLNSTITNLLSKDIQTSKEKMIELLYILRSNFDCYYDYVVSIGGAGSPVSMKIKGFIAQIAPLATAVWGSDAAAPYTGLNLVNTAALQFVLVVQEAVAAAAAVGGDQHAVANAVNANLTGAAANSIPTAIAAAVVLGCDGAALTQYITDLIEVARTKADGPSAIASFSIDIHKQAIYDRLKVVCAGASYNECIGAIKTEMAAVAGGNYRAFMDLAIAAGASEVAIKADIKKRVQKIRELTGGFDVEKAKNCFNYGTSAANCAMLMANDQAVHGVGLGEGLVHWAAAAAAAGDIFNALEPTHDPVTAIDIAPTLNIFIMMLLEIIEQLEYSNNSYINKEIKKVLDIINIIIKTW